jgi:hypothetical protein
VASLIGVGGGEGHQSSCLSQITAKLADLTEPNHESTQSGQRSRADARNIGPHALPDSATMVGSTAAQHAAASSRSQRARAVPATTEMRLLRGRTSVLAALPLPRHRESATADLTTSHRALGDPILLIEGAWKYTCVISTGAVAVFVRVSRRPSSRSARPFHASYRAPV